MKKLPSFVKNYYILFCILEFIFLVIGCISISLREINNISYRPDTFFTDTDSGRVYQNTVTQESPDTNPSIKTEEAFLAKGIYQITCFYEATDGGTVMVSGNGHGPKSYFANQQLLDKNNNKKTFCIWANDNLEEFCVTTVSNGGTLTLKQVDISEAYNSRIYQIICLALKLLLLNILVCFYYYRKRLAKYSIPIVGILCITLLSSLGMLTRYMLPGHDLMFHLLRIEGLKDGLLSGSFPVRIQPNWCNGWGYAVSIMYGDTTLLLPALMRIAGFTVQTSYKTFVIVINLLTALSSFYCFKRICGDTRIGLLGSVLFSLAPYRLCCIYTRAAFGEYTAMMFLPLIALGFWYAFGKNETESGYGTNFILPAVGIAGLIQTHILTCQMVLIFSVLLCIMMIKKVFRKKTFIYLVKVAGTGFLLSLWFLVPFLQYYREPLACTGWTEMAPDYQNLGISLTELFAQDISGYYGYNWSELVSLADKFSIPLGNGLLLCIVIALLALWNKRVEENNKGGLKAVLVLGVCSVWLATNLFPYHSISEHAPKLGAFLAKTSLPYRFLSLAALLLALVGVFTFRWTRKQFSKHLYTALFFLVAFVAVHQSMTFTYGVLYGGNYELHYDGYALDTTYLMGNEYLYAGSDISITGTEQTCTGEHINITESAKNSNKITVACAAVGEHAFVEAPLFYYPGYTATDENGRRYAVTWGGNNRVRILLPDNFAGTITIAFTEPVLWRLSEIISLLTAVGLIFYNLRENMRGRKKLHEKGTAHNAGTKQGV